MKRLSYLLTTYFSVLIKGLVLIFLRRILTVEEVGIVAAVNIIYNYITYAHLGIRFSVDKELPVIFEADRDTKEYESKVISSIFFIEIAFSIIIIGIVILLRTEISSYFFILITIAGAFHASNEVFKVIYRDKSLINEMNKFNFGYTSILSINQFVFSFFYRVNGFIITTLIYDIGYFIYSTFRNKIMFIFDIKFLIEKISVGFPLFINGLVLFSILNIDKIFVMSFFNIKVLGIYSTATMFYGLLVILPNVVNELLFPQNVIITTKSNKIESTSIDTICIIAKIYYSVIIFSILLFPVCINLILPKYVNSIVYFQILVINLISFSVTGLGSYIFIALNQRKLVVKNSIYTLLIGASMNFIALQYFADPIVVALSTVVTFVFMTGKYSFDIFKRSNNKRIYNVVFDYFKLILFLVIYYLRPDILIILIVILGIDLLIWMQRNTGKFKLL